MCKYAGVQMCNKFRDFEQKFDTSGTCKQIHQLILAFAHLPAGRQVCTFSHLHIFTLKSVIIISTTAVAVAKAEFGIAKFVAEG
jgi:hypothetical protein